MWRSQVRTFAAPALKRSAPSKYKKEARFWKVGLPLLLFVVGGYVGLTQVGWGESSLEWDEQC